MVSVLAGVALLALAAAAKAESDGQVGAVSRGTVSISLSVAPRLGAERSAAAAGDSGSQPFCIWSNAAVGTFTLSASEVSRGRGSPGHSYELEWSGPGAPLVMRPGTILAGLPARSPEECRSEAIAGGGLLVRQPAASATPGGSAMLLVIAPD